MSELEHHFKQASLVANLIIKLGWYEDVRYTNHNYYHLHLWQFTLIDFTGIQSIFVLKVIQKQLHDLQNEDNFCLEI